MRRRCRFRQPKGGKELRGDPENVLEAVKLNGRARESDAGEPQADRENMLEAERLRGQELEFGAVEVQADLETVREK